MMEFLPLLLFIGAIVVLLLGYSVAFSLAGTGLLFAAIGAYTGHFDSVFLEAIPNRLFGIMNNEVLIAVPLFVFMGVMLEKSKIAEEVARHHGTAVRPDAWWSGYLRDPGRYAAGSIDRYRRCDRGDHGSALPAHYAAPWL